MTAMIHLALAADDTVMAHFAESGDAAEYCFDNGYTHVPHNLNNRDRVPAPLVGTVYKA